MRTLTALSGRVRDVLPAIAALLIAIVVGACNNGNGSGSGY